MKLDLHNFSHNLENKPIHQISNQSNPVYINEVYRNWISGLFLQELSFTSQKYKCGICGSVHELVSHPQLIRIKLIPAEKCGLKQPDTQLASPDTVFLNDKIFKKYSWTMVSRVSHQLENANLFQFPLILTYTSINIINSKPHSHE